ncbi:MAG TPA: MlaD family protein [Gammaproteobacteria bacterium]|nr:MlaD family protein [Gammaproteobacteria bacterium]
MAEKDQVHYIHRLNYTARERLVGIFVLVAILLLFLTVAFNKQTQRFFEPKFTIYAYITDATGVSTDTPVMVYGLDVGKVTKLSLSPDNRIAVTMEVLERFHRLIRSDSTAEISKLSVIGNAAISIKPGSTDKPMVPNGATVPMEQPLSVDQMMSQVSPVLENVKSTLAQINALSHAIDPKDLNALVKNLAVVSGNLKNITGQFSDSHAVESLAMTLKETQARVAELQPLIKNANAASADMPALVAQSRKLVTQLNTTMGTVNYQLQALPDMVARTRQVLDQTDATLAAIQNTWPISSSVAKPPDATLTPVQPPQ